MNEFVKVLFVFIFLLSGSVLLFFVEKSALQVYVSKRSLSNVRDLKSYLNNGQVVFYSGRLNLTKKFIEDKAFKVSGSCARLVRVVEMYQWCERSKLDFGRVKKDSHVLDRDQNRHNKNYKGSNHKLIWSADYEEM